jgi:hypothetical protein
MHGFAGLIVPGQLAFTSLRFAPMKSCSVPVLLAPGVQERWAVVVVNEDARLVGGPAGQRAVLVVAEIETLFEHDASA